MAIDVQEFPTELTAEVMSRLSAPVPANEIQTKQMGGAHISFTSDKFVMRRLNEVVGPAGWGDDYVTVTYAVPVTKVVGKRRNGEPKEVQILGTITCRLTVLGVTKSAEVDIEFDPDMYGTPATNGQARVFKRAGMKFGIAAELWDKDAPAASESDGDDEGRGNVSQFKKPAQKSSQSSGSGPSANQVAWLTTGSDDKPGLGVPMSVVKKLTAGRDGTASKLMDALFVARRENGKAYKADPTPFIREALRDIDKKLVSLLGDDDEGYEDDDED